MNEKATPESRAKGGRARAEKIRAEKEAERALLAEARRDHLDDAIEKLSVVATKAAAAIDELLDAESEGVRLRAAVAVLEILTEVEILEMSARLDEIERWSGRNGA